MKQNYPSSILLEFSCQLAENVFRSKKVGFRFYFNSYCGGLRKVEVYNKICKENLGNLLVGNKGKI